MTSPNSSLTRLRRRLRLSLCAGATVLAAAASVHAAAPVPPNLSGGLEKLVESNVLMKQPKARKGKIQTFQSANGVQYATEAAAGFANDAIADESSRVLVRVHLNGLASLKKVKKTLLAGVPSLQITAIDKNYQSGVFNAFVSVDEVAALANTKGVGLVALELQPEVQKANALVGPQPNVTVGQKLTLLGTTFDQGVTQHRVDTFNRFYNPAATSDFEGAGLSIGFMSNQYNRITPSATPPVTTSAETDVTNFDLPGAANNPVNTQPVVILQEDTSTPTASATDEGRGMVQIGYKMAPKARLAFATANLGAVSFANNIRALAGIPANVYPAATQQGFAADVVCDDVSYFDEPLYQDGIIAQGVNDAAAYGVSYFSSAGNGIGTNYYSGTFNYVPNGTGLTAAAGNTALANTNINLTNVPTALYAGGFHNFNPNGLDVAQSWYSFPTTSGTLSYTTLKWDDQYNQTLSFNTPAIYTASGSGDANGVVTPASFTTPSLTAGANYVITVTAATGSPFDAIVTIKDPNGNTVVNAQDTGTDETVNLFPTVTGVYTITVASYTSSTAVPPVYPAGAFNVNVYTGNNQKITTDYNLLVFDTAGNYMANRSLIVNNLTNNVPYDIARTYAAAGQTSVQYVLARAAVPAATTNGTHFRIDFRGNGATGGPLEYFTVNNPATGGHAAAAGGNGVAAYSVFRPNVPEYYTSPGPVTAYFDVNGVKLATPDVRLQPRIGAADNANTSFFGSDSAADVDTFQNFSGTSAAAPHAAAIAALVLESRGGRRSVTPAAMTTLLQNSAFPHDLDPNFATGVARVNSPAGSGKVTITVNSDLAVNPAAGAFNPNSIQVSYVGPNSLATLTFNPAGTAAAAGSTTGGNNGLDANNTYFSNLYPGIVFEPLTVPYTVGNGSAALAGTTAAFSNQAPLPSVAGQWWTMALTFPSGAFTGGNVFNFTVGHGPQHNSQVTNGTGPTGGVTSTSFTQADLFGGTVLLPDGTGTGDGMTFTGTLTDGTTFTGTMKNRIGRGYSVTDGYGFINAAAAVSTNTAAQ